MSLCREPHPKESAHLAVSALCGICLAKEPSNLGPELHARVPLGFVTRKGHMPEMSKLLTQYAALPVCCLGAARQVLLVTSRGTGRWIIPKGRPEEKLKPHEVAAMEALEEGGVSGTINEEPLGRYCSTKGLPSGEIVPCEVTVFRLDVHQNHSDWKEGCQRKRLWVPLSQAGRFVDDGGLVAFLDQINLSASVEEF